MLVMLFQNNRGPQSCLKISCGPVPHVAFKYFVLVNSICFVLLGLELVPDGDTFWFQTLCLEEGTWLIARSHGPHPVHFLPTSARILWVCYCHSYYWALFLERGDISVLNQRGQVTAMYLGFELLWKRRGRKKTPCGHPNRLGMWEQVLDIMPCIPVTGADKPNKAIGKAVRPEIWPFTGV